MKLQNLKLALRADSGLALGTIYPLNAMRNILGRSVDVVVPVDDAKVSRIHAAIDQQNGFLYLVDLGSTNGTYLNDRRIQNASLLSVGDRVRVGSASFVVELLENAKTQVGANWKEPTRAILRTEASTPQRKEASRSTKKSSTGASALQPRSITHEIVRDDVVLGSIHDEVPSAIRDDAKTVVEKSLSKIAEQASLPNAESREVAQGSMVEQLPHANFFLTTHGRWISILVATLLVGAALATTFSHPA